MNNLEELCSKQQEIGEEIEKSLINYKKDPPVRKTEEYLTKRIQKVKQCWNEFEANNTIISEYEKNANVESAYTKNKYYEVIKQKAEEILDLLQSKLEELQPCHSKSLNRNEPSLSPVRPAPSPPKKNDDAYTKEQQTFIRKYQIKKSSFLRLLQKVEAEITISERVFIGNPKIKALEENWTGFNACFEEMVMDEKLENLFQSEFDVIEDSYFDLITQFNEKSASSRTNNNNNNKGTIESMSLKLKPISIPNFNGEIRIWSTFSDLFTNLIHNNELLNNAQKMQYLKTNISGEPAKIVSHLQISDENYETAWELLQNRYNNKRMIVNAHLETLFAQPTIYNESSKLIKALHDTTRECIHNLKDAKIDTIILHILVKKLDKDSHRLYEQSIKNPRELQSLEDFFTFLEHRFQTLEAITKEKPNGNNNSSKNNVKSFNASTSSKCNICKGEHKTFKCKKYWDMTVEERSNEVRNQNLCRNCLSSAHTTINCKTERRCSTCKGLHHSSLHYNKEAVKKSNITTHVSTTENSEQNGQSSTVQAHIAINDTTTYGVLLATAMVRVATRDGHHEILRALVDQGSQASFISENAAQKLHLPRNKIHTTVGGIGSSNAGISCSSIQVVMRAIYPSSFALITTVLVLPKLTTLLPDDEIFNIEWPHVKDLVLADTNYNKPGSIDIILGADVFGEIILDGVRKGKPGAPIAQATEFGWILSGKTNKNLKENHSNAVSLITQINIDDELRKFWELEEIKDTPEMSAEDMECEKHFETTHTRMEDGRYVVALPFKKEIKMLGNSKKAAMSQLFQLEKRFLKQKELKDQYIKFMEEYINLGHMTKCSTQPIDKNCYYFPHHAVMKESTTTKLRVVFDGSRKTSSGVSLNDNLLIGPRLQDDLINIVIRFRSHKIAFSADIAKMYRQILIRDQDSDFQRILWRKSPTEPIEEYKLRTVTYGTASAPFLAVRTLLQHAKNENENHPAVCSIIKRDFYVDDLLSGCESEEKAIEIQQEINEVLEKGGFQLRKWTSNSVQLLENIPEDQRETHGSLDLGFEDTVKTLGIHWHPKADYLNFNVQLQASKKSPTKRIVLSEVSKLFDPLGLLAPVIIRAKIMLQRLWLQSLEWDEPLPREIMEMWMQFKEEIPTINNIKINRWIQSLPDSRMELHGFADASEMAFAAVVYARIIDKDNNIYTNIIAAKTRVAPLKQISLPRLELCGAVLLTKLLAVVKKSLSVQDEMCYAWTDSEITLAWIRAQPKRWNTFVANRVATIQATTSPAQWKHVSSTHNPADCASRGLQPHQLQEHPLWWHGPSWLQQPSTEWPKTVASTNITLEQRKITQSFVSIQNKDDELLHRYSSIIKLQKVTAYCYRFSTNSKLPQNQRTTGTLLATEMQTALNYWIKFVQSMTFGEEIKLLENKKEVQKTSKIRSLNPFIDENGILRVGGRLQNTLLVYTRRHPAIIPQTGPFTRLIIDQAHKQTLHGGIQLTLNQIRQRYWIINGRNSVKAAIHHCVTCYKCRGQPSTQLMGNLPAPRVSVTRPFLHTGTDYCGPIEIRMSKGRGTKCYKGYIAIFICLATKAIHIEAVSDLTAHAFIAAFKRFTGRRGHVAHLYSDNASNYVGADKILALEHRNNIATYNSEIMNELTIHGTEWHFIPPASPHFGGLWEAGVKSIKHHLKRTIGEAKLTFEEMATVLTQIEACLNSRPLSPLTDDPDDLEALTPGHFLIGGPLIAPPEANRLDDNINGLTRWQLCSRIQQAFWKRWSSEYLSRLQQRPKWTNKTNNIKVNDMVLLKDEQLPSTRWPLGRISAIHPGKDNMVRVVSVKVGSKEYKRPITKICKLPISDNEEQPMENANQAISLHASNRTVASRKCNSLNNTTFWMTILLSLFTVVTSMAIENPIKTKPFDNQPGIYFENLGRVNLINNEWNIIAYIDLAAYHKEFNTLKHGLKQLENFCEKTINLQVHSEYCNTILQQFQHQIQVIEDKNSLLNQNEGKPRPKRAIGLLAGAAIAGGMAVYGIIQHNKAQEIEKDISKAKMNEQHLLTLLKNQTSLSESTINIIKKNENRTQQQFVEFAKQLDRLAQLSNNAHKESENQQITQILSTISMHTLLLLVGYQNMQDTLLEMVLDIHQGRIHPLIITPTQLTEQLRIIRGNLPPSIKVPGDNGVDNLTQIYKLLKANVRVTPRNIIFDMKIPLLHTEEFQIFKLIPVPTPHNNTFIWIEPSTEYLIINLKRDQYYPINEPELKDCEVLPARELYLCKQHHPIYNKNSNYSKCELSLLDHKRQIETSCKLKSMAPSNTWIQLHNPNSWIYSLDQEYVIDVICDKNVLNVKLNGSGVLELRPNCLIKQPEMLISAHNIYPTVAHASFIPSTNLSNQIIQQQEDIKGTSFKIERTDNSEYEKLQKEIEKLRAQEKLPEELTIHDVHHYSVLYLVIGIIILYSIWRKFKKPATEVNHSHYFQ